MEFFKGLVIILSVVFGLLKPLYAQFSLSANRYDFGEITEGIPTVGELQITNTTAQPFFILRIDTDFEVNTLFSSKTVQPGESATIRFKINPRKKGTFKKQLNLYISASNNAIPITLLANVKYINRSADPTCPDFSRPIVRAVNFIELQVIDAETKEPIVASKIELLSGGLLTEKFITNKNGEVQVKMQVGQYYFIASANGYETAEKVAYVNRQNNKVVLELQKIPEPVLVRVDPIVDQPTTSENTAQPEDTVAIASNLNDQWEELPQEQIASNINNQWEESQLEQSIDNEPIELVTEEPMAQTVLPSTNADSLLLGPPKKETPNNGLLDPKLFAPNNVVFLVDVSASMRQEGRLDLMKAAIIELIQPLRPIDRLAIVTYANEAVIALPSVQVTNKDSIINSITALEARGYTSGAKGIEQAYGIANEQFIANGNNTIFIASDGEFRIKRGTYNGYTVIEENKLRGITISSIGVKNKEETKAGMRKIAQLGGGKYIEIFNYESAKTEVLATVKEFSLIKR